MSSSGGEASGWSAKMSDPDAVGVVAKSTPPLADAMAEDTEALLSWVVLLANPRRHATDAASLTSTVGAPSTAASSPIVVLALAAKNIPYNSVSTGSPSSPAPSLLETKPSSGGTAMQSSSAMGTSTATSPRR